MRYHIVTETVPPLHPEATATQRFLLIEVSRNGVSPRVVAAGFYKEPLAELVRLANLGARFSVLDQHPRAILLADEGEPVTADQLAERLVAVTPGL